MDFEDIGEIGGLFGSWRFIVGTVFTCGICLIVILAVPSEVLGWAICIPVGIAGFVLSVRWQVRSDGEK